MKKLYSVAVLFFIHTQLWFAAGNAPVINCKGLPGCSDTNITSPSVANISQNIAADYIRSIINIFIELVAVIAVFALIFWGISYIVSWGNEEKTWKAKKVILWAFAGVILSSLSWGIVNMLNNISITV